MNATLAKQQSKKPSGAAVVHRKGSHWSVKKAGDGVVSYCVHGPTGRILASAFTPSKLIEALRVGLSVQELMDLQASLKVPMAKLVPRLGISKATLHRRKATGRLHPAQSHPGVRRAPLLG